jgi:hypothetical protein
LESQYQGVQWKDRIDLDRLPAQKNHLVIVNFWIRPTKDASLPPVPPTFDEPAAHGWTTMEQTPYSKLNNDGNWTFYFDVSRWVPPPQQGKPESQR